MSWEPPDLTTLALTVASPIFVLGICGLCGLWWSSRPLSIRHRALFALAFLLPVLLTVPVLLGRLAAALHHAYLNFQPADLLTEHLGMALTLGAVAWLLHRSWQTLWKPVPDLINVLGVDVPEAPDVSLADIRVDAATLSWSRPSPNRPVQKYLIQVNGVQVGDSGNETAITVTGLKPNHFYNIRVVAVGPNNFQAGSPIIRLRTFARDGKPNLGDSRLPLSFANHAHLRTRSADDSDDSDTPRYVMASVEAAAMTDGTLAATRDANGYATGQRRNTINRRHSPSVASMDQPQMRPPLPGTPELSLDELNRKFESIRREIDDTLSLYGKDEVESRQQDDDLKREKDRKRQALKEKDEQTTQLKAAMRTTMEQVRAAEKERAKKEQQLKDKDNKKVKVRDNITKYDHEIARMKKEHQGYAAQKAELEDNRDRDVSDLDESNAELQENCASLEAELKDKGKQLQDLKEAREQLPGADDEQWKESDAVLRRDWDAKRKEMHNQLVGEAKKGHHLDQHIRVLGDQLTIQHQSGLAFYNQQNSSVDFDMSAATQSKRVSRSSFTNGQLGAPGQFPTPDPGGPSAAGQHRSSFPAGLFMDMAADGPSPPQTEAEMRAIGGPLSPTAQSLIPSDIFDESETVDARNQQSPFASEELVVTATPTLPPVEGDPQSPTSSARSFSIFSSPHGSSQNLVPFPQYNENGERMSLNLNSSPAPPPAASHRLTSLLANFQRSRGTKTMEEGGGPPIGTLKAGQSQSLPRTEDPELNANKRRISFSFMGRSSTGSDGGPVSAFAGARVFTTRRLLPFGSSSHAPFAESDQEVSRPASIASVELPRPSTDSSSIWGAPGAEVASMAKNRLWSPGDPRWGSRNGSRRPSLHGSPSALTTSLASADDDILDPTDMNDPQTSPSQVGVIGSRPPGRSKSKVHGLNPNAPTFMGNIFRKDKDKEREPGSEKDKPKAKDKSGSKDKDKGKEGKGKQKELPTPTIELPPSALDDSPSDARMSRDTFSVHTLTSVDESHESLPLDSSVSNTPSDANLGQSNAKDQENVVRKLFRKGSSSKFSLSSRLGKDSGLFKKGPGSTSNSDKNAEHRSSLGDLDDLGDDIAQLGRSYESVTSSPSLGPSKTKDSSKESRMSAWRFSMKKKGKDTLAKEKESLDLDTATEEE